MPTVAELIHTRRDHLSPNDMRVARQLLDRPVEAPFQTVEALARDAGVSKAAVVRFSTRLGFSGFAQLHDALAAEAIARMSGGRKDENGAGQDDVLGRFVRRAVQDLEATRASVDPDQMAAAVAMLCAGDGKIGIFGHRKSAALAEYAYYLLNPLLSNVWPIAAGEPGIADHLIDLEPHDRLLAFTFRRYAKITADVVRLFRQAGGSVVVITDDLLAPAAARATHALVCRPGSREGFSSSAAGIVVLEALAAEIALRRGTAGGRRLDTAEQLWREFGTY
ncbi:MAG TPA: MurR/RpiR family transcriptional regulator [Gaiellales bacterium]|nr:MurR/RpiR family transcriptional regulator [Gaiellales bacterium]